MNTKKLVKAGLIFVSCSTLLVGCAKTEGTTNTQESASTGVQSEDENGRAAVSDDYSDATQIILSDDGITVDGEAASTEDTAAVYAANDIVYYEEGKDFTYGEGTEDDAHSKEEADEHTVVHITEPGRYVVSGSLSAGQIAVDLGEDAEDDPEAVVTLILNNADISCSVAPAVIFYNVYECGSTDEENATKDVDTTAAGANVIIADGTVNNVTGSYVARIYKSVELSEDGTEVVDSKKLHKYDGAFYSKMSMNVNGGTQGTGVLNISAENEGLDSELHLTVNGGYINITSGNDGINTNEDGISVTTINGGNLNIVVSGETGEGDGIDSNGWLVINGGTVTASACAISADAGIDSDMGIHINGGTVIATGNMLDQIAESEQNYMVMSFAESQTGGTTYTIKDDSDMIFAECTPVNDFTYLIVSGAELTEGTYSIWMGETQLAGVTQNGAFAMGAPAMGGMPSTGGMPQGDMPDDMEMPEGEAGERPEMPEGMEAGERPEMPEGEAGGHHGMSERETGEHLQMPEGMEMPEGEMPEGMEMPEGEAGERPNRGAGNAQTSAESSTEFVIVAGGNYFSNVSVAESAEAE